MKIIACFLSVFLMMNASYADTYRLINVSEDSMLYVKRKYTGSLFAFGQLTINTKTIGIKYNGTIPLRNHSKTNTGVRLFY